MDESGADSLRTRWSQIDLLKGRDAQRAWEWFLDRYRPFVSGILSSMFRNTRRGERAAEEFWGYFFQHNIHEKVDRNRRFRAYLSGVVRRFGLDWSRSTFVAQGKNESALLPEPTFVETVAEDEEMRHYAKTLIHICLERLASGQGLMGERASKADPNAARMLRLFYGIPDAPDGEARPTLTASQVARELGVDREANTMNKRMFDTRKKLRHLVISEVEQTVPDRQQLEEELHLVFTAIQKVARGLLD